MIKIIKNEKELILNSNEKKIIVTGKKIFLKVNGKTINLQNGQSKTYILDFLPNDVFYTRFYEEDELDDRIENITSSVEFKTSLKNNVEIDVFSDSVLDGIDLFNIKEATQTDILSLEKKIEKTEKLLTKLRKENEK